MCWAYGGRQRQRQWMLINDVYCSGPGYGPEDSHIQIDMACSKGREEGSSTKNEHNMMQ